MSKVTVYTTDGGIKVHKGYHLKCEFVKIGDDTTFLKIFEDFGAFSNTDSASYYNLAHVLGYSTDD